MDLGLANKTALVTGASRGIGAAVAELLAAEGADVVVMYGRDDAGAERTASTVRAAGRRAWTVAMNAADAASVDAAMAVVRERVGGIDAAVLNAGTNVVTPLAELSTHEWDDVVRVNLSGTFYALRAVRPLIRSGGAVVMVASVAAHTGAPHHAHYAAAKAGIVNLAKSAAREMAPDVRVNCVAPGLTRTPMGVDALGGQGADYAETRLLARRIAEPVEIARAVVFLASPAASFVYGATLDVNGGRELR
jgi:3-oxoacyl-[acyl-carrier protein] reductase